MALSLPSARGSVLNGAVRRSRRRTTVDDVGSSRPVFFQTCPATHHQGLRAPPSPKGNVSYLPPLPPPTFSQSLAVPRSVPRGPPQSPAVAQLSLVFISPGITHLSFIIFYIFSFPRWYCVCYRVVSFVLGVLPFLYCNWVRTNRTRDGNATYRRSQMLGSIALKTLFI